MAGWIQKLIKQSKGASEQNTPTEPILTAKEAQINLHGEAIIPQGTQEIGFGAYQNRKQLRCVRLPDSVKKINSRAFAGCESLEKVILNEGLEVIEGNVFNGCSSLKTLVFPDSLKEVHAYAFYCTSLQEPVYNRSGDILHHYPCTKTEASFTVPQQVKVLFEGAFFRNTALEEVILPEGLGKIECRAFLETNIRRVTIPSSVIRISSGAFWNCPELELINLRCSEAALKQKVFHACPNLQISIDGEEPSFEQELRIKGRSLLGVPRVLTVPDGDFWKDSKFVDHAARCAGGDAKAMMEFAEYLEGLGNEEFYGCAANFWRYRAYQYGDIRAEEWKNAWLSRHPRQLIPSVISEELNCVAMGEKLRALGFMFFDPEREYDLRGKDANGIVEVSSWCGEEGPDNDGFGREELYDWWYLDEHLNHIPGVKMHHSYSKHDREAFSRSFDEQYAAAVSVIKQR